MTVDWPFIWNIILLTVAGVCAAAWLRFGWSRLDRAPGRPRAFSPLIGGALLLAMLLMAEIGLGMSMAAFEITIPADGFGALTLQEQTKLLLGRSLGQLLVVGVYLALAMQTRRPANDRRMQPLGAAGMGVAALVLFWPMASGAGLIAGFFHSLASGEKIDPIAHETLALLLANDRDLWAYTLIALVTIAAPIVEEVLYRGILQESLRRLGLGSWFAIVLASIIFTSMHLASVPPWGLAALFVLSLGFGWVYEKSGRLIAPIVMHIAFNAGNVALALLLQ